MPIEHCRQRMAESPTSRASGRSVAASLVQSVGFNGKARTLRMYVCVAILSVINRLNK